MALYEISVRRAAATLTASAQNHKSKKGGVAIFSRSNKVSQVKGKHHYSSPFLAVVADVVRLTCFVSKIPAMLSIIDSFSTVTARARRWFLNINF